MKRNIFRDKVIIVTGASSGIGRATALEFARQGSKVVIAARSAERLATLEKEITDIGTETLACVTDVTRGGLPETRGKNYRKIRHSPHPDQ